MSIAHDRVLGRRTGTGPARLRQSRSCRRRSDRAGTRTSRSAASGSFRLGPGAATAASEIDWRPPRSWPIDALRAGASSILQQLLAGRPRASASTGMPVQRADDAGRSSSSVDLLAAASAPSAWTWRSRRLSVLGHAGPRASGQGRRSAARPDAGQAPRRARGCSASARLGVFDLLPCRSRDRGRSRSFSFSQRARQVGERLRVPLGQLLGAALVEARLARVLGPSRLLEGGAPRPPSGASCRCEGVDLGRGMESS